MVRLRNLKVTDKIKDIMDDVRDSIALDDWYRILAETCIEHMKYVAHMEEHDPTALTVDDYGLLELERGYLALYAERTKGGLPTDDTTPH